MRTRDVGRLLCMFLLVGANAIAAASCGSSGSGGSHAGGEDDASIGGNHDGATGGGGGDSTTATGGDSSSTTTPPTGGGDDGGGLLNTSDSGLTSICVSKTCQDLGFNCGMQNDGCNNVINCGSCASPAICGGGGPSLCGTGVNTGDSGATTTCTARTCASQSVTCGPAGDGCGNLIQCGDCTTPDTCGGGGVAGQCGQSAATPDGGGVCTPATCASLGINCGSTGDGCGGSVTCGTCASPAFCGGGGANVCGGNSGVGADGGSICVPATCASLGFNCGPAGDGCGALLQCGTCTGGDTCGGGGPGVCGNPVPCTGLCKQQVACDGGATTSISGTVFAGKSAFTNLNPDPVPNVLVYIPNAALQPIGMGYTVGMCPQCGADVSGSPLVSTYTNFDGTFTLPNVPFGTNIPLVIQLGRWRRQFTVNIPNSCQNNAIGSLNLPRNKSEGNIPVTAISTGNVDALECVLLKMGVDQAEFTSNTGLGRIHIYSQGGTTGGAGPGAHVTGSQSETALMGTGGTLLDYDQVLLPCWGTPVTKTAAELGNLITYADNGGHFFDTHYSYSWLATNGEFANVATWATNTDNPGNVNWTMNVSTVPPVVPAPEHSGVFYQWLNLVGALSNDVTDGGPAPTSPQVLINNPRFDVQAVANGSLDWVDGLDQSNGANKGKSLVEHFTFNTPVNATNQCGHAIFSDFHVSNSNSNGQVFPAECTTTFTAQEKILEYMLFDLASCVGPPVPSCTPTTCAAQNVQCGPAGDGCGNQLDCGTCVAPQTCGGGGVSGMCGGGGTCTPKTCEGLNVGCGPAGDGCGNLIQCGTCPTGQTCGGGGVAGQCGTPPVTCTPQTCAQQSLNCGPAGDGCGNQIDCGPCPAGETCGGGGTPGQCGGGGTGTCTPRSCAQQGIGCGPAGDGCGNLIQCGTCPSPMTCGGGGTPGQCGGTGVQ